MERRSLDILYFVLFEWRKSVKCYLVIALNGFQFSCVGFNYAIAEPYKRVEKLAQKYSLKPLTMFFPFPTNQKQNKLRLGVPPQHVFPCVVPVTCFILQVLFG